MALDDNDIKTAKAQSRRKMLARMGGAIVGALAVAATSSAAKARDAKDFIARDNKGGTKRDSDQRQGDSA